MKNLFIAYAIIWIGLFLYLWKISSKLSRIEKELQELKRD